MSRMKLASSRLSGRSFVPIILISSGSQMKSTWRKKWVTCTSRQACSCMAPGDIIMKVILVTRNKKQNGKSCGGAQNLRAQKDTMSITSGVRGQKESRGWPGARVNSLQHQHRLRGSLRE